MVINVISARLLCSLFSLYQNESREELFTGKWLQICLVNPVSVEQMFHSDTEKSCLCFPPQQNETRCWRAVWHNFAPCSCSSLIIACVLARTYTWLAGLLSPVHSFSCYVVSANVASWPEKNKWPKRQAAVAETKQVVLIPFSPFCCLLARLLLLVWEASSFSV